MEKWDEYERGHSENVARLAENIGIELGLSIKDIGNLWLAGVVHDIGKIGIAEEILNKPGPLDEHERQRVKYHVDVSMEILQYSVFPPEVIQIVAQHHERFDGKGYPRQLKGNQIDLGARILAAADVFDALISERTYRTALSKDTALNFMKEQQGVQFDPAIVDALFKAVKGMEFR